jgi:hypothetical protein
VECVAKTRIPRHFGLAPVWDIQVLCPMNRGVGAPEILASTTPHLESVRVTGAPRPKFCPKVPDWVSVTGVSRAHRPVQNIDLIKDLGRSSRCDLAAEVGT